MKAKNDFSYRASVRALVVAFALGGFSVARAQVPAVTSPPNVFVALERAVSGNATTLQNGTANAGNIGVWELVPDQASGDLKAKASGGLPVGGKNVPVDIVAKMPKANVAKALATFATKIITPITVGMAIFDLLQELNVTAKPGATPGANTFDLSEPVNEPGGRYYKTCGGSGCSSWKTTPEQSCYATPFGPSQGMEYYGGFSCYIVHVNPRYEIGAAGSTQTTVEDRVPSTTSTTRPITSQQLADIIASKSGWPSTSAVGRATADAIKSGESVAVEPTSITGPASSVGSKTVTNDGTNTTTNTTTNNYTYEGNKVTVTTITISNSVNNSTGQPARAPVVTENSPELAEPVKKEEPVDPCKANPQRVGCMDVDAPTAEIPKESKSLTYSAENPFGEGSCPANLSASLVTLGKSVTVWDWQKTCELALPLRALVLALASFAAFLIIMPGKVET